MSTLAEIIEEGKRLEEAYLADQCAMRWDALVSFRHRNFPRLLAVAEAAVEWAEADAAVHTAAKGLCTMPFYRAAGLRQQAERELRRIAFDAAASGEGRG